jgi:DNA repair exonuclease SbcCD ATPase subunit
VAVVVLMVITSGGIYGYLSAAYSETSVKMELESQSIDNVRNKKIYTEESIGDLQKEVDMRNERIKYLSSNRERQESRQDALLANRSNSSAKGVEKSIQRDNEEINKLRQEVSELRGELTSLKDTLRVYDEDILMITKDSEVAGDIGPLKYISELTGKTIDQVVNWFIMALIFVFDPLAVSLVIGANIIFSSKSKKEQVVIEEEPFYSDPILVEQNKELVSEYDRLKKELERRERTIKDLEVKVSRLTQDNDMLRDLTYDTAEKQSGYQTSIKKLREEKEILEEERADLERLKKEIETWESTHWKMRRNTRPPSVV